MKTISVLSVFLLLAVLINTASTQSLPPYKNPNLPVEQRVNDLVSRMTLEEKIGQMVNNTPAIERLGDYTESRRERAKRGPPAALLIVR